MNEILLFLGYLGWGFIILTIVMAFLFLVGSFLAEAWNAIHPPRGKEMHWPAPPRARK